MVSGEAKGWSGDGLITGMKGRLRTATIWLGVLLSIVFAGLAFYGIDWRKTGLALRAVQWPYLGVAFVLMWAGFAWRTVRWKRLLDVGRRMTRFTSGIVFL